MKLARKQLVERCVSLSSSVMLSRKVRSYLQVLKFGTGSLTTNERGAVDFVLTVDAWDDYWLELSGHGSYQRLRIVKARLTFGYRFFIQCECGRACVKLYWPPDAYAFRCRRCYGLTYRSSNETRTKLRRLIRRADRYGRMEYFAQLGLLLEKVGHAQHGEAARRPGASRGSEKPDTNMFSSKQTLAICQLTG